MKIFAVLSFWLVLLSSADLSAHYLVGYIPSWQGAAEDIQYAKFTNINYAFIVPSSSGDGTLGAVENPSKLRQIVELAHAHGVKVSIAVGGWTDLKNSGFEILSASSASRETFAEKLLEFLATYKLDGVDIDWEYPQGAAQSHNYGLMMHLLADKLHARGKILSAAVADGEENGGGIPPEAFEYVDYMSIMAYDGDEEGAHSPYSLAENALEYWLDRGLPQSKAVLGVPFYARPSWKTYKELLAKGADPHDDDFKNDNYNGMDTIARKADLAIERGNGVMIWEISGDVQGPYSLVSVIAEKIGKR
ncbi:MAG: glycosyl hydrolase family 18 protein [Desulfocapsaceae bacterium]|nr:glycosyl hydrolase family 18 protein [Desulfocapsaceae bacterium]